MAQSSVVTELRTKLGPDSQDIKPIGTNVKYIKGDRLANNNLEEELLLGSNKIITSQNDFESETPSVRETIEYRSSGMTDNYYVLERYKYGETNVSNSVNISQNEDALNFLIINNEGYAFPANSDPKLDSKGLHLNSNFYVANDTELHEYEYDEKVLYDIDSNKLLFYPTFITEKDELYYQVSSSNRILIASKSINEYQSNDNIHYRYETITRYN